MVLVEVKEEKVEYIKKIEIKKCDICGGDATDVTKCFRCKGDFCIKHLYIIEGIHRADYGDERWSTLTNNFCFPFINLFFPVV